MHIIIREPILLTCGKVFSNHIVWRAHSLNVNHSRIGEDRVRIEPQVYTCDANGVDEVLNLIATHAGERTGVSLMRESAGYYVLQVFHD